MKHLEELTAAELRVLELMAHAGTNLEIAVQLEVSPRTVESQVQSIMRKLDLAPDGAVDRRVSAVLIYLRERGASPVTVPART